MGNKILKKLTITFCSLLIFNQIQSFDVDHLQLARIGHKDLRGFDLSHANLNHIDLTSANCTGANFEGSDLTHSILNFAIFIKAKMQGAILNHSSLIGTCFKLADLRGAQLACCNARFTSFRQAKLAGADLSESEFFRATFNRANLTDAQMLAIKANQVNFNNANLRRTNLTDSNLTDSPIEIAKNYSLAILEQVMFITTPRIRVHITLIRDNDTFFNEAEADIPEYDFDDILPTRSMPVIHIQAIPLTGTLPPLEETFCTICQSEYTPSTLVAILLCGHNFCNDCISRWFCTNINCPLCKGTQTLSEQKYFVRPYAP